ncbi:hypothetical protein QE152_g26224 [Popillia japonica]|uniref:Secreted protein n=1 Tax=Popillia japonica TaxID=7064 RepID=A0AAW1JXF7_POPJA
MSLAAGGVARSSVHNAATCQATYSVMFTQLYSHLFFPETDYSPGCAHHGEICNTLPVYAETNICRRVILQFKKFFFKENRQVSIYDAQLRLP